MPDSIKLMLENFLVNQGKSLLMAGLTALLTLLYAHFAVLSSFISQNQVMSWASAGVVSLIVIVIHLFDHNYAPPAPPAVSVETTLQSTAGPNAPAAPAAQPSAPSAQ